MLELNILTYLVISNVSNSLLAPSSVTLFLTNFNSLSFLFPLRASIKSDRPSSPNSIININIIPIYEKSATSIYSALIRLINDSALSGNLRDFYIFFLLILDIGLLDCSYISSTLGDLDGDVDFYDIYTLFLF